MPIQTTKRSFKQKVTKQYEDYRRKKNFRESEIEGGTYKKRKSNGSMKKVGSLLMNSLGSFNGLPMLLLMAFIYFKWNKIEKFLFSTFRSSSTFYRGKVSDLPHLKDYYVQMITTINNAISGVNLTDSEITAIIKSLNNFELQYMNDIYNASNSEETLAVAIRGEFTENLFGSQYYYIKERFVTAGIPF